MYSETDLQSAVAAGALTPQAADALRAHVADLRQSPMADEEQFRLITGFNDIFVSIAAILFLTGCAWVGGSVTPWLGAALVTASAWGMAEFFTARRRMERHVLAYKRMAEPVARWGWAIAQGQTPDFPSTHHRRQA